MQIAGEETMYISIRMVSSEKNDNTIVANKVNANGKENRKEDKNGKMSFFAGETNLVNDPVAQKRKEAQKLAMKIVKDAWESDKTIDDSINGRKTLYTEMYALREEERKQLSEIEEQEKQLQEAYGIDSESKEQKDLELMKKQQDFLSGVSSEGLSKDEMKQYASIDKENLTEYQKRALELNAMAGVHKIKIREATRQMKDAMYDIKNISLERLKSDPMVDAKKNAKTIMDAANEEIFSMLVNEAKEFIDEEMEEKKEAAKEKAEEKEEQDEVLEDLKEKQAIQEALIEGTKEAIERAKAEKKRNDSPDVELTDMMEIAENVTKHATEAKDALTEIRNSMNLLEADLKGIQVDEEV